jgi:hypothetical protein
MPINPPVREVISNAPTAATTDADTDEWEEEDPSPQFRCNNSREEYFRSAETTKIDGDVVEILLDKIVLGRRRVAIIAKGLCTRRKCDAFLIDAADAVDAMVSMAILDTQHVRPCLFKM